MAITETATSRASAWGGTITTIPATATEPEIRFHDTGVEVTYSFLREDGFKVEFALTPEGPVSHDLTLAVLDPAWDNWDATQQITLSYAEARLLRAYLQRPEVARRLDAAE